jgi:hypothetical protein
MTKRIILLLMGLVIGLAPGWALAVYDYKSDSFGIYFDAANSNNSGTGGLYQPFPVYLVLMNPTGNTNGFECTVTPSGTAPNFALSTTLGGTGALDVDSTPNGFAVGAAANYPVVNGGLTLVTWSYMLTGPGTMEFRVSKASIPSMTGNMPVVTGDGILRRGQVYTCDVTLPVATVNGSAPTTECDPPMSPPAITVDIDTSVDNLADTRITASTTATASNNYDAGIDIPKPTPPPGNYVTTSFEHTDWSMGPRFATDVRVKYDPATAYQVWPLMVETDRSGFIRLAFTPSFDAGANYLLYLRDRQSGQYYNLYPALTYVFTNNGLPNTYRFDLLVGAAPVPPALTPGTRTIPAGWAMVGLPLAPLAGATVGAVLTDPPPGYAYAFDYVAGTGYRNLPASTPVAQGTGYWLATDAAFDWTMSGTRDMDGTTVALAQGWNLVGNANWFPGSIEGLRVIRSGNTYTWLEASAAGLVSSAVQAFNPATGAYTTASSLEPWNGYWINALDGNLTLQFYWGNFVVLTKSMLGEKSLLDPDDNDWRADLTLQDAADQRRIITIGARGDASAGFDALFDTPLPPQPPVGGPSLSVWRPEWDLTAGAAFSTDLVNLQDEASSWPIVITTPNQGRAVLTWDPKQWPEGADFQLYVPAENRVAVRSMRSQTNYVFKMGSQAVQLVVRTPNFTSGVDPSTPTTWHMSVQPNPFNPQTTISFDLPTAGRAEVRIYSVRGELVTVLGGEARTAGSYREVWNGADRQGRDAPSGSYFARLYVDGQVRGEVTKMSLLR